MKEAERKPRGQARQQAGSGWWQQAGRCLAGATQAAPHLKRLFTRFSSSSTTSCRTVSPITAACMAEQRCQVGSQKVGRHRGAGIARSARRDPGVAWGAFSWLAPVPGSFAYLRNGPLNPNPPTHPCMPLICSCRASPSGLHCLLTNLFQGPPCPTPTLHTHPYTHPPACRWSAARPAGCTAASACCACRQTCRTRPAQRWRSCQPCKVLFVLGGGGGWGVGGRLGVLRQAN